MSPRARWSLIAIPILCAVTCTAFVVSAEPVAARDSESRLVVESRTIDPEIDEGHARLRLAIVEVDSAPALNDPTERPVPARVVLKTSGGVAIDGALRGVYDDGRFYVDGALEVTVPAGSIDISVSHGPEVEPLEAKLEIRPGERIEARATLVRWRRLSTRGWRSGDLHVHARHDAVGAIRSDLAWAALQARANGLDFVIEAGSHGSYEGIEELSSDSFLFAHRNEIRPGPFVGHLLTPGVEPPISSGDVARASEAPLPARRLRRLVIERGGALVHTHPLVPAHQAHWMGAVEILSDAVVGECAHGFDLETRFTETLWFAVLELGNRVAATASTDAALGRSRTRSPGDRRVWVRADELSWPAIVDALRKGRTVATDDGPVFAMLRVGESGPGDTIRIDRGHPLEIEVETLGRHPLRSVELIYRGRRVETIEDARGRESGVFKTTFKLPDGEKTGWLVARAEDERGHWAMTSPIFIEASAADAHADGKRASDSPSPVVPSRRERASAVVFEISNASRFAALTTEFFAHAIVTVAPPRALASIRLVRDRETIDEKTPPTSAAATGPLAVTGMPGAYTDGVAWHGQGGDGPFHVQADWRVRTTGWHRVIATTTDGDEIASDAVFFDAEHPDSHALTAARLAGSDFAWRWQGYGEELPLADVAATEGADRWWYPRRTYARVFGSFGDDGFDLRYGPEPAALRLFRDGDGSPVPQAPGERISFLERKSFDELYTWLRESKHRDPRGVFRLEDGRLRISGEALGYIGTRRAFRDYCLTLEYRWGEKSHGARIGKARDSGLFLHAVGPDGNSVDGDGAFRSAIECQIMEGATGDLMLIRGHDRQGELIPLELSSKVGAEKDEEGWPTFDPSGRQATIRVWGRVNRLGKDPGWKDELGFRSRGGEIERPAGEWNRIEATCQGDEIEVRLNGSLVHRATKAKPSGGQILLQSEGSEIEVRRFEIEPLMDVGKE